MKHFGDIAFTEAVKRLQSQHGSRMAYAEMTARDAPAGLSTPESLFIAARDSFYMATVNAEGWPYVQHRGGPVGFLKVLSPNRIGFADYRGNRQYVSVGNLSSDRRVSLFLMDYPNRRRLKLFGLASVKDADSQPELAEQLTTDGQGRVERLFTIDVEAFDWNCPQFITQRFTQAELAPGLERVSAEPGALQNENAFLKAEVERLRANKG